MIIWFRRYLTGGPGRFAKPLLVPVLLASPGLGRAEEESAGPNVIRIDVAAGPEGFATQMFVGHPLPFY